MAEKIKLKNLNDEGYEERQPLNAMVAENLKEIIIQKVQRDVSKTAISPGKISPLAKQYLTTIATIFQQICCGMAVGYSAVLLPQLMAEDTEISITANEGTWIASLLVPPIILGCLTSGYLMDLLGRKRTLYYISLPFTAGWIVVAFAPNILALYAGRLIIGYCLGILTPLIQVYLAETTQPDQRGVFLSACALAVSVGILISHILGTFLSWRTTGWICGIPPLICNVILLFVKESPAWLVQKGKPKEAEEAFKWFRGNSEEVIKEFNDLLNVVHNAEEHSEKKSKVKLCLEPSFYKPFTVLNFFFFFQQFSGVNAVTFYSVNILKRVLISMNEYYSTILIDSIRLMASIIGVVLLKKFGSRPLAITSALGTSLSLFLLTIYLGCIDSGSSDSSALANTSSSLNFTNKSSDFENEIISFSDVNILDYLPLVFLIAYICFVTIGLVPLPWVLTGELFSKDMRGVGSGISTSFAFVCFFVVVKLTPTLFEKLTEYGTFCFFGVITAIGSVMLWKFLPETKNKTLHEIEMFFNKKK